MPTLYLKDVADAGLGHWDATPFLNKVTDIVPSIIYIFNQDKQSNEYSNRSLGHALGYSGNEVLEMGSGLIPQLCHPDDLARVIRHFGKIMKLGDGEVEQVEYRLRHKDGHWIWLLSNDTVFDRTPDGKVLRHIGVASDISAQKEAEARAISEQMKANATNAELRAFSYSMSHDMKAPSNTLHLLLNELLDAHGDTLNADAKSLVGMALATVDRMGTLVKDVLNYTNVINDDCFLEVTSLETLMDEVLLDLHPLIAATGGEVQIDSLPRVLANRDQMQVLFRHLIENAINFRAPDRAPVVTVSASGGGDTNTCQITVQDNGIGIPPEKQDQIFTIFKRLGGTAKGSGSGLGLAICRRIAANHASEISVISSPGNGAAFTIGLQTA